MLLPLCRRKKAPNFVAQLLNRPGTRLAPLPLFEQLGRYSKGRENDSPIRFNDVATRHHLARDTVQVIGYRARMFWRGVAPDRELFVQDLHLDRGLRYGRHFPAASACWLSNRMRSNISLVLALAFPPSSRV